MTALAKLPSLGQADQSRVLAAMSHELRTPLNAILGFAQLLQRDQREPLTRKHRDYVEEISRAGEQLLHLIDEILDQSEPARHPSLPAVAATVGAASPSHKTLLYVEDNAANVALMRELCAMLDDVQLLVAGTAELGIELARTKSPDLIAMDINLPGMNGIQALKELRSDPVTAAIPVVAVTAAALSRDRQTGVDFDAYLTKPIHIDAFLTKLEELLRPERQA